MTVNEAHLIYFSPTHTSKQVAEAIVHGTGIKNILPINVTQQIADEIVIPASALAIIVVPVTGCFCYSSWIESDCRGNFYWRAFI